MGNAIIKLFYWPSSSIILVFEPVQC